MPAHVRYGHACEGLSVESSDCRAEPHGWLRQLRPIRRSPVSQPIAVLLTTQLASCGCLPGWCARFPCRRLAFDSAKNLEAERRDVFRADERQGQGRTDPERLTLQGWSRELHWSCTRWRERLQTAANVGEHMYNTPPPLHSPRIL